ncbi:hypothetical protein LSCM1_00570 [Leishmania martiniquensis]|uniref:Protein-tyrosine-phosphatase n=1 Tax=Leishmania martiniquensis TaxID=1580590 RepID=A0A836FYX1_9TRYP|nr:hypothetical protein LSCM1_00570 [Leishmania martiniquensis]
MLNEQIRVKQRFDVHLLHLRERVHPTFEDGFDRELAKLRRVDAYVRSNLDEFYSASLGSSMAKNRFPDVKPNECTIVRLSTTSSHGDGTYINANYIDAREKFNVPFVYIATQAPMQNTVPDFWRMVFENDSDFIVMLCAVEESGKVKSEAYWPPRGETYDLGLLSVTLVAECRRQNWIYRRLLLYSIRGKEKEVDHMQYLTWPDQGVPKSSLTLMEMIDVIAKSPRSMRSPIVVHCSGGVGRTGVFICLHIALTQFQLGQTNISIPRIVRYLKACRSGMVRRKDQYIFLYYAVQREMARIILSQKVGVDLLNSRPRLVLPTVTRADPVPTQIAAPLLTPLPVPAQRRYMSSIPKPLCPQASAYPTELRSAPIQIPQKRNAENDVVTMENYLQRAVPSLRLGHSPGMSDPARRSPPTEALHSPPQAPPPSYPHPNSTLCEPDIQWRHAGIPRSSTSRLWDSMTPSFPASSLLQVELARQRQANRMKRFSPSLAYGIGDKSKGSRAAMPS